MVRKDKTPKHGFDVSLPVASDWLYWVETLGNGGTIDYIDEVLGRYRRHSNNITKKETFITQNELDHLVSCQIIMAKFPEFFSEAINIYSKKLIGLRYKVDYLACVWKSFCLRPTVKALGGLGMYFLTFGKVKL